MRRILLLFILLSLMVAPAADASIQGIVGGKTADPLDWPSLTMLRVNSKDSAYGTVGECTANLVARRWVLTAAHCFGAGRRYAYLAQGTNTVDSRDAQWVRAAEIHIYPGWNDRLRTGDLAMLRLPEDWSGAMPISWWRPTAKTSAMLMGWGDSWADSRGRSGGAGIFRSTPAWVYSPAVCGKKRPRGVGKNTICAGDRRNICFGDSGGPLVVRRGGVWRQIGITSATFPPCGSTPSLFTGLYAYQAWVGRLLARG